MDDGEKQVESWETHTSNDALCERTTCEVWYLDRSLYILSSIITLLNGSSYFNSFSAIVFIMSGNPMFHVLWNICYIAHFISVESLDGKSYPLYFNLKLWFQNFNSNYKKCYYLNQTIKNAIITFSLKNHSKLQFKVANVVFYNLHGVIKLYLWLLQERNTRGY